MSESDTVIWQGDHWRAVVLSVTSKWVRFQVEKHKSEGWTRKRCRDVYGGWIYYPRYTGYKNPKTDRWFKEDQKTVAAAALGCVRRAQQRERNLKAKPKIAMQFAEAIEQVDEVCGAIPAGGDTSP